MCGIAQALEKITNTANPMIAGRIAVFSDFII